MKIQLTLARRYLAGRRLRTTLTTLAVVFGVMLLFGLGSLAPTVEQAFRRTMAIAAGEVDLTVTHASGAAFAAGRLDAVRAVEGIALASPSLRQEIVLPAGSVANGVTLVGIDPATARSLRDYPLIAGRFLEPGDGAAIVAPEGLAGLEVGGALTLPSAQGRTDWQVVGIVTAFPGEWEVYVPLAAAQQALNLPGQINTIEAVLAAGADPAVVEPAVAAAVGTGFRMEPLEAAGVLGQWSGMVGKVTALIGLLGLIMGVFIVYNTFRTVALERRHDLGMLRALGATRRTVIALVLIEGLIQGLAGAVIGMVLGYSLAWGVLTAIRPLFEGLVRLEIGSPGITAGLVAQAVALGLGTTLLGALAPALSASRVTPLEALRPATGAVEERRLASRQGIAGLVLLLLAAAGLASGSYALGVLSTLLVIAGLVLLAPALVRPVAELFGRLLELVFAREGQIARGNMARQPGRAAVTASTVMISLAILLAVVGLMSSLLEGAKALIDRSLGADFLVMPPSLVLSTGNVGASPALAEEVRALPEIGMATTLRLGQVGVAPAAGPKGGGDGAEVASVQVIGVDPATFPEIAGLEFKEGEPDAAYQALAQGGAVILNPILASQAGAAVGDLLRLETPAGPRDYRVAAVALDFLNFKLPTGYLSQADLARDWGIRSDLLLMANAAPGVDRAAAHAAVAGLVAGYPALTLTDASVFKAQMEGLLDQAGSMYILVLVVMAVPALIALVNTLAIGVLERRREIGVLRAVGATRRQVRRMIAAESLLLAALGTACGIAAGLWLGYALVSLVKAVLLPIGYHFPFAGLLAAVAAGLLLGVLAATIPARQAARLEIVESLRYE